MCTANGAEFGSVAEALRVGAAFADYLNSPAAADLELAALGEALVSLGEIQSKLAVAHADFLCRFDAHDAHEVDGYNSSAAWLAARVKLSRKDAKAAVRRMRMLGRHPLLARGMAAGEISESWAREIVGWLKRLPEDLREGTEKILADAAAGGASLEDLAVITAAAWAQWEADHPDEDDGDDNFPDRFLQLETTLGGAGVIRGDLTPECASAVTAVVEALGKKAGPEDDRSTPQRFHDALQLACELLLRARLVPDRAGADTQVVANISLRDLRAMPGASGLEDVWIRALLGEGGYLTGADAEAAACDAMIVPVVAGSMNATVLDQMINLVLGTFGHNPERAAHRDQIGRLGADAASAFSGGRSGAAEVSPQAWQALRYGLARLAVDLVSGPAGVASVLRRGLLEHPWNTPSLPLDIGYSESIPAAIRRAVNWRDRYKCAWPGCGRPASWCDVHHIKHKKDGGKTSVDSCVTLCHFHHDVCIHRWGWRITLNPDGTTSVYGPDGQIQHSHSPPTAGAG
ncbi:MAG: DUF222 domain-containing protein [Trebonia sp.]|jgi:hypothetical protein